MLEKESFTKYDVFVFGRKGNFLKGFLQMISNENLQVMMGFKGKPYLNPSTVCSAPTVLLLPQ